VYRIGKRFTFEAAHQLPFLPHSDPRSRVHGHSYTVEVAVAAEMLSFPGFVVDFAALDPVKRHLAERLDHRLLNEVLDNPPPTGKKITTYLRNWCEMFLGLPRHVRVDSIGVWTGRPDSTHERGGFHGRCGFEAAHRLPGLPREHKCARLHGHSYTAALAVDGDVLPDPDTALLPLAVYVAKRFGYRCLNEVLDEPATSEHLAEHLYRWAAKELDLPPGTTLGAVRVSETASTWAEYAEHWR
jgi:6-pyruvoyltetrahydropterin/6-carboxytetrahydropterin synthase